MSVSRCYCSQDKPENFTHNKKSTFGRKRRSTPMELYNPMLQSDILDEQNIDIDNENRESTRKTTRRRDDNWITNKADILNSSIDSGKGFSLDDYTDEEILNNRESHSRRTFISRMASSFKVFIGCCRNGKRTPAHKPSHYNRQNINAISFLVGVSYNILFISFLAVYILKKREES